MRDFSPGRTVGKALLVCGGACLVLTSLVLLSFGGSLLFWAAPGPAAATAPYQVCLDRRLRALEGQPTALGASPDAIAKLALGEHRTSIRWHSLSMLNYEREGEETELVVRVTRAQGAPVFVHSTPNPAPDPSGQALGWSCGDSLLIPVHVEVETTDKLLRLSRDVQLVALDSGSASVSIDQSLLSHAGNLVLSNFQPSNLQVPDFNVSLGFTERGMSGLIRGECEAVDSTAAMAVSADFTCFPEGLSPQEHGFEFPGCQD